MGKGIADQFIRDITGSSSTSNTEPRVVLVRSSRSIKQFITESLGEIEKLVAGAKEERTRWDLMVAAFERLSHLAEQHSQHNVHVAARDIHKLASYAQSCDSAQGPELRKSFGDFVTHLSTMLLRVYIEGSDEKCVWELASIEVLLTQSYRQIKHEQRKQQVASQWVN